MNRKHSFSYGKIAVIGSGFLALTLVWTIYNTFMPLILGDYIESSAIRGAIMGFDNLLAVLLIPVIGAWSDRVKSPLGQRLPFIAVGMPLAAITFALLPFVSGIGLFILLAIDIVFLLAMTVYRAPVISLMPDHTPSTNRSTANGVINFMGGVGAIIALFVLSPLFDLDRIFPFVIGGCILFVAFILLYLVIDRNPPFTENTAADQEETQALKTLKDGIKNLFIKENRGKLFIFYAIFLYFIGYTGVEALFSIWATEQLGLTGGEAGVTLGFFSLSFVLFAIPAGLLGTRFGKKPLMLIGLIFLPLLFAVIPFLEGLLFIRVVLFLAGIAWACINVQAYALVSDLGGTSKIGLYTGLYYLFSMSSAIIAPFLLGTMMDLFGRDSLFFTAAITMVIAFLFLRAGNAQSAHVVNDSKKSM
ncbi:MFS transporter [Alkalihalobacterium chitinilyticum]|uniref:MFS transporter n=1 Tax=Alkalihalobacterium chitinilyticum TaxID=2980103 RepID=A0ABT5VL70_9BACI|nr:MFS transporter [Alkalihalobacterium chitinilyticum]MDE5416200.1 MFS transporter [Alkalihalobacterium chitinilyticum]